MYLDKKAFRKGVNDVLTLAPLRRVMAKQFCSTFGHDNRVDGFFEGDGFAIVELQCARCGRLESEVLNRPPWMHVDIGAGD